jgi:hypothetical protein
MRSACWRNVTFLGHLRWQVDRALSIIIPCFVVVDRELRETFVALPLWLDEVREGSCLYSARLKKGSS